MPINLPKEPKGKVYEDLLAACLLGKGYWTEANLHLRDGTTEILELDLIGTPLTNPLNPILIEAKSGSSAGFADLFKVSGWINYLKVPRGVLVRTLGLDDAKKKAMESVAAVTNVRVAVVTPPKIELDFLGDPGVNPPEDRLLKFVGAAWYGKVAQRLCLAAFEQYCKSTPATEAVQSAKEYRWAIEQSFLRQRAIERANAIYQSYMKCPGVTGKLVGEASGGNDVKYKSLFDEIWESGSRKHYQYVLFLENVARGGIVKNALIHILQKEQQGQGDGFDWNALFESIMPASFQAGLAHIQAHPHRNRIPYLYQIFVEVFGGWYSLRDESDLEFLSQLTGIPTDQIVPCLNYMNELFPTKNGWYVKYKDELCLMKMVPAISRGTGAFLRNMVYGIEDYKDAYPKMGFLVGRWHNALYQVLEKELKAAE